MESSDAKTIRDGWIESDNRFYHQSITITDQLLPSYYDIGYSNMIGYYLTKLKLNGRNLIQFPDSDTKLILDDIKKFWQRESIFRQLKLAYKRGILMYGPPGGGKTSCISQVIADVIALGGVVLKYGSAEYFIAALAMIRKIHPNMPVICLMEDVDKILEEENMSDVLNLLDGVDNAADKVVFLATTNHLENLPDNIKNRPSRFDRRFNFGPPASSVRELFLRSLVIGDFDLGQADFSLWAQETEGFSFAHLKELFISVIVLGNPYAETLKELKEMFQLPEVVKS